MVTYRIIMYNICCGGEIKKLVIQLMRLSWYHLQSTPRYIIISINPIRFVNAFILNISVIIHKNQQLSHNLHKSLLSDSNQRPAHYK